MSEDFLSRWSRLKRESNAGPAPRNGGVQPPDSSPPAPDPPPAPAIDVSSLPAIESINAESNVAVFLQAGVPDDLVRGALRSAWVSDPAIRDFVGIAENQWDFNGEGTIAGFGSLTAEECARYLADRTLQAETAPPPEVHQQEVRGAIGGHESTNSPPIPSATSSPQQSQPSAPTPVGESRPEPATPACGSEFGRASRGKRTHGSALPK